MNWQLPGTTLSVSKDEINFIDRQFFAMFLGGGMVLSQVSAVTGLEPYTVQNWVKRGFLPSPEHKRYNMNQLCRVILINTLKNALSMDKITHLIAYVNGVLDDDSDDLIDDATLYFLFVRLAAQSEEGYSQHRWEQQVDQLLSSYAEPVPGARDRVKKVLRIMLLAWSAARLQDQAEQLLNQL